MGAEETVMRALVSLCGFDEMVRHKTRVPYYSYRKRGRLGHMLTVLQGKPDGVNYHTRSPLAESIRDHFRDDVIGAIDIGVELLARGSTKQPPLHPFAEIGGMMADGFTVQKAALAGMALLDEDDPDTHQRSFVSQQGDEAGMRQEHKGLVGPPAQLDLLLPAVILADDQCPNMPLYQHVNDVPTGNVQIMIDLAFALIGQDAPTVVR